MRTLFSFCCLFIWLISFGQSQRGDLIQIMVSPEKPDMVYKPGESVSFNIRIFKFGHLYNGVQIVYKIGPEKMDPVIVDSAVLENGEMTVSATAMDIPGFLTCQVFIKENDNTYMNSGTAGIAPDLIEPTTTLPEDFKSFWDTNLSDLEEIPVEAELTLMPERCTDYTNVYHVKIRNIEGWIYGILTKPKKEGKYPAILHVPGAGVRPYYGDITDNPVVTFQIGIHGIPVNLYQSDLYDDLRQGMLNGYWTENLDDRDKYYYRRVYLGCVRAVDFIHQLPEFDGENIGVMGGSQGGALSIVTAGLDNRIDCLVSYYPALSDLTGYLYGRAGGWPHMFTEAFTNKEEKIETSRYYDVVNFARHVQAPGFYSFGFNDNVCPPTSVYAAINVINAPKEVSLYHDAAHWTYPEQSSEGKDWIYQKLGVQK